MNGVFVFFLAALAISRGFEYSKHEGIKSLTNLNAVYKTVALGNHTLRKNDIARIHNFKRRIIKLIYFQESNLVSFVDNDTKVSGVCGELWNIMADYLNFTLVPLKYNSRNFGLRTENGSYDGVLGYIEKNQAQIVPRTGIFTSNLPLLDYTIPLWKVHYSLYIKPEWKHDEFWVVHLFSTSVWYTFFIMLLVLAVAGFICEKCSADALGKKVSFDLTDHITYTVALAGAQGSVPAGFHSKSRIVYISTSIFAYIVAVAFSSHAIFLMMNKKTILPFTGLRTLIQKSKYNIAAFRGSMSHNAFKDQVSRYFRYNRDFARVIYRESAEEVYRTVCFSKTKFAAFEAEDRHMAIGRYVCRLIPTDANYFETWITSAVKRGFPHKSSFDNGMLKIIESGLLDGLKDRWLDWKSQESEDFPFQSIDMSQMYLIFGVLLLGFLISIWVLLMEHFARLGYACVARIDRKLESKPLKI